MIYHLNPVMIDRSLQQIHESGMAYVQAPAQCWQNWFRWLGTCSGSEKFHWWETCGLPGWDFGRSLADDEGNVFCCMKPVDHEGDHGFKLEGLNHLAL